MTRAVISASSLPPGFSLIPTGNGTATLTGTPGIGQAGLNVSLTAKDSAGTTATDSFTIAVLSTNARPPVFSSTPLTQAREGVPYLYSIAASDPDGETPTMTLSGLPAGFTFTDNGNGTAALSGTPVQGQVGTFPLTLTARDSGGNAATQIFAITMSAVNNPPSGRGPA